MTAKTKLFVKKGVLLQDIRRMIEKTRSAVATTVNVGLTMLYWQIGKRINEEILKGERAKYGEEIIATLSQQLSWSHFKELLPLEKPLQRDFYAEMCRVERWSVRHWNKKHEGSNVNGRTPCTRH